MDTELNILMEDNHLLVLNKPAPLATMGVAEGEPSLLSMARRYIGRKYNKPGNVYLGVVSRLDSFVTGTVIFARTSKSASRISKQFRDGTIEKRYLAIIPDDSSFAKQGTLQHSIYKNDAARKMFAVDKNDVPPEFAGTERDAELKFCTLGRSGNRRLIEIELITGRKHQIRAQLTAAGCPVIGDRKYSSEVPFKQGIALHCRSLRFLHPTLKTELFVTCKPPDWWNPRRFGIS